MLLCFPLLSPEMELVMIGRMGRSMILRRRRSMMMEEQPEVQEESPLSKPAMSVPETRKMYWTLSPSWLLLPDMEPTVDPAKGEPEIEPETKPGIPKRLLLLLPSPVLERIVDLMGLVLSSGLPCSSAGLPWSGLAS
jgi:hypothetical protein